MNYLKVLFIFAIVVNIFTSAVGQNCQPTPDKCNDETCGGGVALSLATDPNSVFCQGEKITMRLNQTQISDFDSFFVYWCDNTVDKYLGNVYEFSHTYIVPENQVCAKKSSSTGINCRFQSTGLTVYHEPRAKISGLKEVCKNVPFTLDGSASCNVDVGDNNYTWTLPDGTIKNGKSVSLTFNTTGNYTVNLKVHNRCGDNILPYNITVVDIPTAEIKLSANAADSILCEGERAIIIDRSNSWGINRNMWSYSPNVDLLKDTMSWKLLKSIRNKEKKMPYDTINVLDTLIADFLKAGTYRFTLTSANQCGTFSKTVNLQVKTAPKIKLEKPVDACETAEFEPTLNITGDYKTIKWTFVGGVPNMSDKLMPGKIKYATPGNYLIKVEVISDCGTIPDSAYFVVQSKTPINITSPEKKYCIDGIAENLMSDKPGATWSGPGIVNTALGTFDPKVAGVGGHKITCKYGTSICNTSDDIMLEVLPALNVEFNKPLTYCENASYTPDIQLLSGKNLKIVWTFPNGVPAFASVLKPTIIYDRPGTYTVNLLITTECDTFSRSEELIVYPKDPVKILSPSKTYCKDSSPDTLKADISGGTWTGSGIKDKKVGLFDPSIVPPGDYTITYTAGPLGCQSSSTVVLKVVASQSVTVKDFLLCEDTNPTMLTAMPSGGEWSGTGTSTDGIFDPAKSKTGSFNINYKFIDANQCEIVKIAKVIVEKKPVLHSIDTTLLCIGNSTSDLKLALQINADSLGGTYKYFIDNVEVNPLLPLSTYIAGVKLLIIEYSRNMCKSIDTAYLSFEEKPILMISNDTTLCINDGSYQLYTSLKGGTWTGPNIEADGTIDLKNAGPGMKSYTYTFQEKTTCEQIKKVNITIEDPSIGLVAGGDQYTCVGPSSYQLTGFSPTGGIWSGLSINANGLIDLAGLKQDSSYTYKYCLQSTSGSDKCEACVTKKFILRSLPIAAFEIKGLACIGQQITLVNKSSKFKIAKWDLGDGTMSSNTDSLLHTFNQKKSYSIILEVIDEFGCAASNVKKINVNTKPISDFTIVDKNKCTPYQLELINNASGDNITYEWEIDGKKYKNENPNIILNGITQDSTYTIKLTTSNECDNVTHIDSVRLKPYPIVNFGIGVAEGCSPLKIDFSNVSLGNPDSLFWDFGNGNSYIGKSGIPPQIYNTEDTIIKIFKIVVKAINECGEDTLTKFVKVYPPNVHAFIEASAYETCQYDSIHLQSFSTPGSITTWEVISPSGKKDQGYSGQTFDPKFSEHGIYKIILYAARCGYDTASISVLVKPAPTVDFELPDYACAESEVSFTNKSIALAKSEWDFGDGFQSNLTSPIHIYTKAGTYTVTLKGYSLINNCPITIEKKLTIVGRPIAAFANSDLQGCQPHTVIFIDKSTGATSYNWNFNDQSSNSTMQSPSHTFEVPGTYTVVFTVHDAYNCFNDTSIVNVIVRPKPKVEFSFIDKLYCTRYDTLHLINQSNGAVKYLWTFDGKKDSIYNPSYPLYNSGFFNVKLIASTEYECEDEIQKSVRIGESPLADFVLSDTAACQPAFIRFTNKSIFADRFLWIFGDGNSSTDTNPTHLYLDAATQTIALINYADNNCPNDTAFFGIKIFPKPLAKFNLTKDSVCGLPQLITAANESDGNKDNQWYVNGNQVSDFANYQIQVDKPLKLNFELYIENEFNCKDTSSAVIETYHQPNASFDIESAYCEHQTIVVTNNSINANYYAWEVDGFGQSKAKDLEFIIDEAGIYSVKLIAYYNELCKDSLFLKDYLNIYNTPKADFDYTTNFETKTLGEVQFENLSTDYNSVKWLFGDGFSSEEVNPLHEYNINRGVDVTLYAYNSNDGLWTCIDTLSKTIAPEWITTFYAPNVLSPDYGDDLVRVFKPVGIGIKQYNLSVYSPWGIRVWHSEKLEDNGSPAESWNGTFDESPVPQGAYSWQAIVEFVDGRKHVFNGSVTVLR